MFRYDHSPGWFAMSAGTTFLRAEITAFGVLLLRVLSRPGGSATSAGAPPTGSASADGQLLAERFARGDIDEDAYSHRLGVLRRRR
ncbi:SHOCT domain-containing protein [Streptomyces sp. NK08204]|uniref:SHOCT domain-containing protein n=1 Tax=Streptomyces sp. NK08204 TaxID=2873260 RepID=UPI001CEDE268|nr:SHOCT domain-containing protein [Streptomyces sp. NK08204]